MPDLGTPEDKIPKDVLAKFTLTFAAAEIPAGRSVLRRYGVKDAEVAVIDNDGVGEYLINEPRLSPEESSLYRRVMADLFFSLKPADEQPDKVRYVIDFMDRYTDHLKEGFPADSKRKILYYIVRDIAGYGALDVPMSDPNVEEVECSGYTSPVTVVHRDFTEYLRLRTNIRFLGEAQLGETVQKLVQKGGKSVTIAYPYSDFILPEGHRGAVTYSNEISLPGSTFDIRKFPADPLTITMLIRSGTMTSLMAAYEWMIQEQKAFTLITGAVSSGKTTMLNALLSTLHPAAKIFTVEDSVTGDSEILVSEDGVVRKVKIGPYVDAALSRESMRTMFGHELARPERVRVLTADRAGRVSWGTCTALIRHRVKKDFVRVTTKSGRSIEVTADHSLFTLGESGDVVEFSGKDISEGTYILTPNLVPVDGVDHTFKLVELSEFSDYLFKTAPAVDGGQLRVHATHSPLSIPATIQLNDDLAFLSGLWVADGFYGERSVGFSAGGKGIEVRIRGIARSLGVNVSRHTDGVSLLINSKPLRTLFTRTLQLNGDDYNRHVPRIFFGATDAIVASFLRGYFTGDGNVSRSEIYAESASMQLLLDLQTLLLRFGIVLTVGHKRKVGSLGGVGTYKAAIRGRNQIALFKERIGFEQPEQMQKIKRGVKRSSYALDPIPIPGPLAEELKNGKKTGMNRRVRNCVYQAIRRGVVARQTVLDLGEDNPEFKATRLYALAKSDFGFDRVVAIERSRREENVYDLSVPETGTFVANNIVCHNTPEMRVGHQNWVRMMTRSAYTLGAREMGLMELVKAALRYRPDYLIVGEVRGEEVQSLVQAAAVGHGALTTIHAESPQAAMVRMRSPPLSVGESFLLLIWSFVQMGRVTLASGKEARRVLSITELVPDAEGGFDLLPVFTRDAAADSYSPTKPEEVVKKSERLKSVMELRGVSERRLLSDLKERTAILDEMVEGGVFKYKDVASRFLAYYKNGRKEQ